MSAVGHTILRDRWDDNNGQQAQLCATGKTLRAVHCSSSRLYHRQAADDTSARFCPHLEVAAFLLDQELLIELLDEVDFALLSQLVREVLQDARYKRVSLGLCTLLTLGAATPPVQ